MIAKNLLDTMETYCEKCFKGYPTNEDKEQLKSAIEQMIFYSKLDIDTIHRIEEYYHQIEFPTIYQMEKPVLYWNTIVNQKIKKIEKSNWKF